MPDEKLVNLAEQGKLKQSSVLEEQIERMLSDAKGMRFVENFLRVWLELDNIGKMPLSKEFVSFYRDNLEAAMQKTEMLFDHVLRDNLSPLELLTADYSFNNRELGAIMECPELKRMNLAVSLSGEERGGILDMEAY